MKYSITTAALAFAICSVAAPVAQEAGGLSGTGTSGGLGALPSLGSGSGGEASGISGTLPSGNPIGGGLLSGVAIPTGLPGLPHVSLPALPLSSAATGTYRFHIKKRQDLGSLSGSSSGLSGLSGLGGGSSSGLGDLSSLGGSSSSSGLGGSSSSLPDISSLGGSSSSSGLGGLSSGLPDISSLGGSSSSSGLGGLSSSLPDTSSLGGSSSSSGLTGLSSGLPDISSLGGSSSSSGLTGLSSGVPDTSSLGSVSRLLIKARQDLSSLSGGSSGLGDLGSLGSGTDSLGSLASSIPSSESSSLGGLSSTSGLSGLPSGLPDISASLGSGSDLSGLSGSSSGLGDVSSLSSGGTGLKERQDSGTSSAAASTSTGSSSFGDLGSLGSLTSSASGALSSNDVVDNTGCKKVTLIYARGTTEVATLGSIVGPSLASNLQKDTGSAAIQGVDYPASAEGNAGMGSSGGPTMAKLANQALSQCPDTKIVLGGYSQGAMVVHYALSSGDFDGSKVAAVAAFGDPENGSDFKGVDSSKVVRYCGSTDGVCDLSGKTEGTGSHLSYGSNTAEAASKIASIVGVTA